MGCEEEAREGGSALQAVCWGVVRALWNALCATPRRTGPLCAAFVNTALMPRLFVQQVWGDDVADHTSEQPFTMTRPDTPQGRQSTMPPLPHLFTYSAATMARVIKKTIHMILQNAGTAAQNSRLM